MVSRISEKKSRTDINLLKEVGYILLLITFFVGIIIGSFSIKNVESSSFEDYNQSLIQNITKEVDISNSKAVMQGIEVIAIFWIVGMSVLGMPVLIGFLGYKGYSLGYTIGAVIRAIGTIDGNKYIFENIFLKNALLVFVMIFLANYSIKISKNFFEKKTNIKVDFIKYTIISTFMVLLWIIMVFFGKILTAIF